MVSFPKLASAAALFVASLSGVAADLVITNPSSTAWWVAKSDNLLAWTCHDTTISNFTVLVGNTNPQIAAAAQAIIAIQENFQCSIIISQDQADQAVGTGWQILFADPFNNTNVYATSEPFEIKALGSAYPTQTTPSSSPSGTGASATGSGASASTTPKSGAVAVSLGMQSLWGAVGAGVGVLALAAGWA